MLETVQTGSPSGVTSASQPMIEPARWQSGLGAAWVLAPTLAALLAFHLLLRMRHTSFKRRRVAPGMRQALVPVVLGALASCALVWTGIAWQRRHETRRWQNIELRILPEQEGHGRRLRLSRLRSGLGGSVPNPAGDEARTCVVFSPWRGDGRPQSHPVGAPLAVKAFEPCRVLADSPAGKAERLAVKTGAAVDDLVEVSGDVRAGDRLIVRGGERVEPGQAVSVQPLAVALAAR